MPAMGDQRADLSTLHLLVPVRGRDAGKSRLGEMLDAEEREALILGLLERLLETVESWPACRRVFVVSADPGVREFAREHGATALVEPADVDLNGALRHARDAAVARHSTAILILPADLPLVSTAGLDRLLDAADAALAAGNGRPLVVAAPSDARGGTNALLLSPPTVIDPAFGPGSLEAHVRAARLADASVQLVIDPQLGFDLDTPDDLERVDPSVLLELTHPRRKSAA
jgi:2-phospho-L-lactate guanylyltransferase